MTEQWGEGFGPGNPDAPAVYYHTDLNCTVYRASALGGCERALIGARLDVPRNKIPANIRKAFQEGHDNEPTILDRFNADHPHLAPHPYGRQRTVPCYPDDIPGCPPGVAVLGHVDDWGCEKADTDALYVVDAKAFAASTFAKLKKGGLKATGLEGHYRTQMALYLVGVGAWKGCLAIAEKNSEGKVTADSEILYHWMYAEDLVGVVKEVGARIARVETAARELKWDGRAITRGDAGGEGEKGDAGELKLPDCPGDWACQYKVLHDPEPEWVTITGRADRVKFDEAVVLRDLIKEADATVKVAKARLNEVLGELVGEYGDRFADGKQRVTWVRQEVAERTQVIKAHKREYAKWSEVKGRAKGGAGAGGDEGDWAGTGD